MIPSIQSQPLPTTQNEPAKRDSSQSQFTEALELQTTTLLNAVLDPSATASLPGAGMALVQAESADADVSSLAAEQLSRQESRKGARERGLDAASQARHELGKQGESAQKAPETPQSEPSGGHRSSQQASSGAERARESAGEPWAQSAALAKASDQSQTAPSATGVTRNTNEAPLQQGQSQQAASAAGAVSAGAGSSTNAAQAGSGPASGVAGVTQASSGGGSKPTPTMLAGQGSAPLKQDAAKGSARVIRHEPRSFEAQLQRGLAQVLRQSGGTLSLKLDPVDLGTVKVSLALSQGRVEGSIEASSERARGLLHEHLDTLKSSLEQRGITVDRLEVRLAGATESERQFAAGQDAGRGLEQQNADAGGDRQSGSFRGEDRQAGDRGGNPGERTNDGLRGAEPTADEWYEQGRSAEPLGGWLRLDTLA